MKSSYTRLPPRSAYLHIPFCKRRCFYCDFPVVPLGDSASGENGPGSQSIQSYLKLLLREIDLSPSGPALSTVYIGGGTPSLLSPLQIGLLLEHLRNKFGVLCGAELTMEMDPATFDKDSLEGFLNVGINRVSLGGQSFDDEMLAKIGRAHRKQHLIEACSLLNEAMKHGYLKSWSLDLIQNLPGQHLESWRQQLNQAVETCVPHLSVYDLLVEPGTVFAWREGRGELALPEERSAEEMFLLTSLTLRQAGFARYEISNYSYPGHISRHNRVYWNGSGWWGFGQGATSSPWGQRMARPRTREAYRKWLDIQDNQGPDSSLFLEKASRSNLDELILLGLRCREGVDLKNLAFHIGWDEMECKKYLPSLEQRWEVALEQGWLKKTGQRYQLTDPYGMNLSNQVLVEMMIWWDSLPPDVVDSPKFEELQCTFAD